MADSFYWDGYEDGRGDRDVGKRFRRNKIDGVVGGVCAGIADYIGWDPVLVRILTLFSIPFTGGTTFWVYVLLWLIIPSDKRAPYYREARETIREARRSARPERRSDRIERYVRPPTSDISDVRSKFRSIETRMQDLERSITSKEWQLRRDFKDLDKD